MSAPKTRECCSCIHLQIITWKRLGGLNYMPSVSRMVSRSRCGNPASDVYGQKRTLWQGCKQWEGHSSD